MSENEAGIFSILLGFGFAVIQMPVLPVEPGMAQVRGQECSAVWSGVNAYEDK